MRLIVLAGLVAIEKINLAVELAEHFAEQGQRVTVLDNITRISIDPELLFRPQLQRLNGDVLDRLPDIIASQMADTLIFATSENYSPDALFIALDELSAHAVQTLALIDLRTCDCFPHMRQLFEDYADIVVNMPYDLSEVLENL